MARTAATKTPEKKSTGDVPKPKRTKPTGIHAKMKPVKQLSKHVILPPELEEKALGADIVHLKRERPGVPHVPTPESRLRICKYVAFGMPRESIMALERLDDNTLHRHYQHEMAVGAEYITFLIANSLMQQALAGNTSAAQYYLSRRAKWTETINHKHEFTNSVTEGAKDRLLGNTIEEDLNSPRKR